MKNIWEIHQTPTPGWYVLRGTKAPALCNSKDTRKLQDLADLLNDPEIVNLDILRTKQNG